jgi:hypothetical protein
MIGDVTKVTDPITEYKSNAIRSSGPLNPLPPACTPPILARERPVGY